MVQQVAQQVLVITELLLEQLHHQVVKEIMVVELLVQEVAAQVAAVVVQMPQVVKEI